MMTRRILVNLGIFLALSSCPLSLGTSSPVLHAVPSQQLGSLVSTLATAVRGRAQDLATLSEATADLPQRLLQIQAQLRSLIVNGPKVTGVLAANAPQLADDIAQTAVLADI